MALDEATTAFLTQLAESGIKPLHEMTPVEARAVTAMLADICGPGPDLPSVEDVQIPVNGGTITIRILAPDSPRGVLVYYHGGGWVIGSIPEFDTLGRILAQRTGLTTVLVDYRLAPEHRYPTAVEDSWAALGWVDAHRHELSPGSGPLVVAGDSAGGNLGAIMTQRAKAAGVPSIDLQVLAYPITDCNVDTASYLDPQNQLILTRDGMIWFWDHYVPESAARTELNASPGRAEDLSGLPPAVVLTAEHDVLRDEGEDYAGRLADAGVPVRHQRFVGQMHGFLTMVNVLPGSAAGIDYVATAIDEFLAKQPT